MYIMRKSAFNIIILSSFHKALYALDLAVQTRENFEVKDTRGRDEVSAYYFLNFMIYVYF